MTPSLDYHEPIVIYTRLLLNMAPSKLRCQSMQLPSGRNVQEHVFTAHATPDSKCWCGGSTLREVQELP